jgi:hypothetical protein
MALDTFLLFPKQLQAFVDPIDEYFAPIPGTPDQMIVEGKVHLWPGSVLIALLYRHELSMSNICSK